MIATRGKWTSEALEELVDVIGKKLVFYKNQIGHGTYP
jgi:RNA-binding protein YhbY